MSPVKNNIIQNYFPNQASIILTFTCNAQCAECCFECSPKNPFVLTREQLKNAIDQISEIPSIKFLIWTGGEVFLRYPLLLYGIKYAFNKGLCSRIVSNGYWGSNKKIARERLLLLKENGLVEINFSTGDNHQRYVDYEKVINSAVIAAELGIVTLISVETNKNLNFTIEKAKQHPLYRDYIKKNSNNSLLKIIPAVWVSFHEDQIYEYEKIDSEVPEIANGCDSIFTTLVVDPKNRCLSCCGLTVEYISELQLGYIGNEEGSLLEIYNSQKKDFMKQWLFVDGPVKILTKVKEWNPEIKIPEFYHFCQSCAFIFKSEDVKITIFEHYREIINDVQRRFVNKIKLKTYLQSKDSEIYEKI